MDTTESNIETTILMPVHNGLPYVKETINSILDQTYKKFEFLIIDDGSTDGTIEYLESLDDSRIRLYKRNHSGIIASFNFGLSKVTTKYTVRIDADDFYLPDKLQKQIYYMEANPHIGLSGSGIRYLSENSNITSWAIIPPVDHNEIVGNLFRKTTSLFQPAIIFRTELVKQLGGQRDDIFPEDIDMFFRLSSLTTFGNIPEVLMHKRLHNSYSEIHFEKLINSYNDLIALYSKKFGRTVPKPNSKLDMISMKAYKKGLNGHLNNNRILGFFFLGIASLISPKNCM